MLLSAFFFIFSESRNYAYLNDSIAGPSPPRNITKKYESQQFTDSKHEYLNQVFIEIHECNFNKMYDTHYGGAFYAIFSQVSIVSTNFIKCSSDVGGSLFLARSDIFCDDCHFKYSFSHIYGGAICMTNSNLAILSSNLASGTQFATNYNFARIHSCSFEDSVSFLSYGAILFESMNCIIIESSNFTNCSCSECGGAIGIIRSTLPPDLDQSDEFTDPVIINSNFTGNKVKRTTYSISENKELFEAGLPSYWNINLRQGLAYYNDTKGGGAIAISDYSMLYTENTSFTNNRCERPNEKIKPLLGNDIFFINVPQYYSQSDLRNGNDNNSLAFEGNVQTEFFFLNQQKYDGEEAFVYEQTSTFTPQTTPPVVKKEHTPFVKATDFITQSPLPTRSNTLYVPSPSMSGIHTMKSLSRPHVITVNKALFEIPTDNFTPSSFFSDSSQFTQSSTPSMSPTQSPINNVISASVSIIMTLMKSVTVEANYYYSYTHMHSLLDGTYVDTYVESLYPSYLMYIIYVLSPSYVNVEITLEKDVKKSKVSPEQLIGIVCGSVGGFFAILSIGIMIYRCRTKAYKMDISSPIDFSSDDEGDNTSIITKVVFPMMNTNGNNNEFVNNNEFENLDNWL